MLELSDSNYMNGLAAAQDAAVGKCAEASRDASAVPACVQDGQGVVCTVSSTAVEEAVGALNDLLAAAAECSQQLAERLRKAAEAYRGADQLY